MKLTVFNGSPKGQKSVTLQSINFLQIKMPEIEFEQINLMSLINKVDDEFSNTIKDIKNTDGVIWCFPLYHLSVPGHMKRFIERIYELNLQDSFKGIYGTTFTTSIHYFDNLAHDYMEGISNDFQMNYLPGLSHDMYDLLKEDKQEELIYFVKNFKESIRNKEYCSITHKPLTKYDFIYRSTLTSNKIKTNKRTVIVTDANSPSNIDTMIKKYISSIDGPVEVVNINDIEKMNYCIGCCHCGYENICRYDGKDDYREKLDLILDNSDIVVYAGQLKDRYFSSKIKTFFDRTFCYTHIPIFKGRQIAYLVSGPVSELPYLKDLMYAYASEDTNLGGIVSDECQDNYILDQQIENLVRRCISYAEDNYIKTATFQAVGAKKIFRDSIKDNLGLFIMDYKYYKANGYFKNKSLKSKLKTKFFRFFISLKPIQEGFKKNSFNKIASNHLKLIKLVGELNE